MDTGRHKSIFFAALDHDADQRETFLASACDGDVNLRAKVEALLDAHDDAGTFMAAPTADLESEALAHPTPPAPEWVGPYRVIELLGEGGFGTVYLAEQEVPVRRRVAVKIIRPGMDSEHVIARFEAERQALAMMDHPAIARVLEAGTTDAGRHYFAMEYVEGHPINKYCDQRALSIPERLEIFEQVCHAVQHAHQKGIIHRDLKPTNVLVTEVDGRPTPKVIDFGIAKAIDVKLTEQTLVTAERQFVGTPEYMSPEQAGAEGMDLDTRTDIYSLGVILYELLAGATPFEPDRFRNAALFEIQRIIHTEEPPRPSSRIGQRAELAERAETIARARRLDPKGLRRSLRGDLDWIVMKALEKDRARRYETAHTLAMDIRRHLEDEPVLASPPSFAYRGHKFVRRHRATVTAAAAVLVTIIIGFATIAWVAIQAREAAEQATAMTNFMRDVLSSAHPERAGVDVRLIDVLAEAADSIPNRFSGHPLQEATVRDLVAGVYIAQGMHRQAEGLLEPAYDLLVEEVGPDDPRTLRTGYLLLFTQKNHGSPDAIEDFAHSLLERLERTDLEDPELALSVRRILANSQYRRGNLDEAEKLYRIVLAECEAKLGRLNLTSINTLVGLAQTLRSRTYRGDYVSGEAERIARDELQAMLRESVARHTEAFGPTAIETLRVQLELADYVFYDGTIPVPDALDESETIARNIIEHTEGTFSDSHWLRSGALMRLASVQHARGEFGAAADTAISTIEARIELLGDRDPEVLSLMNDVLPTLVCADRNAVGTRYTSALVTRFAAMVGPEHDFLRRYRAFLAYFLIRIDRIEEGAAIIAALDEFANPPAGIYDQTVLAFTRGVVLGATGRTDEARLALEEAIRLDAETDEGPVFLRTAIARALAELDA